MEIKEITLKIKEIENARPWDARLKANKDAEKQIAGLSNEAKKILVKNAIVELKSLGYDFKVKGGDETKGIMKLDDGFEVYIDTHYYVSYGTEFDYTGDWGLTLNPFSQYGHTFIWHKDKDFNSRIHLEISKLHQKYLTDKQISNINQQNAKEIYKLVKSDVTYKSGDYTFERENREWSGNELGMKFKSRQDEWHNYTEIKVSLYDQKFDVDAKIRITFDNAKTTELFWDEFKLLVKKYTNYVKEEPR